MAKRRRSSRKSGVSPVVSMLFGLAVGLSVAVAVYVKDRRPAPTTTPEPEPASLQSAIDDNGERIAAEAAPTDQPAPHIIGFF